ncbi:MAG: transcriptional regulator [Candidatus Aenigmarchaeota archaeon]|nr:transcriptional regulator [Candidatus Aenigmarchaeota archaeon]
MRRDKLKIIDDILEVTEGEIKKTIIMYRAGLSFRQLEDYLSFLKERGLIINRTDNGGKVTYKISKKGRKFRENYRELVSLMT